MVTRAASLRRPRVCTPEQRRRPVRPRVALDLLPSTTSGLLLPTHPAVIQGGALAAQPRPRGDAAARLQEAEATMRRVGRRQMTTAAAAEVQEPLVSHVCGAVKCKMWPVTPQMPLTTVEKIMDSHGVDQLPVVSEHVNHQDRGLLIGFVDRECITIARRAVATKEFFSFTSDIRREEI